MATDIARTIMIGRLTRDPELRYTQSGASVASFSLAVNQTYMSGGEKREKVSFFNCIAWGKRGEAIAQYCKKGHRLLIEARPGQRTWEDQNGNKRNVVEFTVETFQFLQPKAEGSGTPDNIMEGEEAPNTPLPEENPFPDDDIPF